MKRKSFRIVLGAAVLALAIQFVPVSRTNPPVATTPAWDSPRTERLARVACYDCHSNETRWPWYTRVAPVSWLLVNHVNEGREHFNLSRAPVGHGDDAADEVRDGGMPLWSYTLLHPEARLSPDDKAALADGLERMFDGEESGAGHEHDEP